MSLEEMRALIERHVRPDAATSVDGFRIAKVTRTSPPGPETSGVVMALIVQGAKHIALGDRIYEYGAGQYLVTSVDMPITGHFTQADADEPALGIGLDLRPTAIAELLLQSAPGDLPPASGTPSGMAVSTAPPELLDAVLRLLRLLDRPRDRAVLAPLVVREILWHLIVGEQGSTVRQLGLADSSLTCIARSVRWIRSNFAESFRVEDVAREAGMSVSAFHRSFQAVTAMSPIQFQKQIRLQAARIQLVARPGDITGISRRVGYDSPSQFSREYRRQFGLPPSQDAMRMRAEDPTVAG
ncbi:AraC family transcriptional regulator [Embleya sp. NPDC005575]|uniref:AraC family transcriptional regulator n=1 Tax=Embleya sp. NPDC005575 TaxID=3156892 RepID=UPI0033B02998